MNTILSEHPIHEMICDAAHEKVPNRRNGVINMVI